MNDRIPFARLDDRVDALIEPWRDKRAVVVVFTVATALGDFGILWHIVGFVRAIGSVERLHQAIFFSTIIGVESLILNQGIKRFFRRTRPTERGDDRFALRKPRTSSFPSGHSSSAFFSALVLTSLTPWPWWFLFYAFAVVVATSRVGVRIHHASDVIGGIIAGTVMGIPGVLAMQWFIG
jgi:undecaprenyl-diphosphatase